MNWVRVIIAIYTSNLPGNGIANGYEWVKGYIHNLLKKILVSLLLYIPRFLVSGRVLTGKDVHRAMVTGYTQQRGVLVEVYAIHKQNVRQGMENVPLHSIWTQFLDLLIM